MSNAPDDSEITELNQSDLQGSNSSDGQEATLADDLPPELLVYIFETAQNMLLPSEQSFRQFPLVLGDVSQYWRQVAFGAPTLWSSVDISHPWDLTALHAYLGRSKDCPIDLHLSYKTTIAQYIKWDSDVSQLILIMQPHYHRCRSIRLFDGKSPKFASEMMKILRSMCDSHYPMLQCFLVEGFIMDDAMKPCAFPNTAPNLTSVRLGGFNYCRPPLNAVTELHLAVATNMILYVDFSEMLRTCGESLITLYVYDDLISGWPADLPLTHAMPSLRYLRILGNMLAVSQLLLSISAPDLQELTIAPIVVNDLIMLEGEISHGGSAPRFPALKSLTLAPAQAFAMEPTLGLASTCFPGIELLILPSYYCEYFLESFLTEDAAAEPRWPELDGLAVRNIDHGRQGQSVLYEFVKDRQRLGVPLHTLYLDSSSMQRMTQMDWLKGQISVVEADPWQIQCGDAFYSDEKSRFLGSGSENDTDT